MAVNQRETNWQSFSLEAGNGIYLGKPIPGRSRYNYLSSDDCLLNKIFIFLYCNYSF